MTQHVYIKTFGCQMNIYDSEKMFDVLNKYEPAKAVDTPEAADIILINTCSIREKAQEKLFSELGRYHKMKIKGDKMIELQYPNGHPNVMVEVTYPDGEVEFWDYDKNFSDESKRLQKIHNGKLKFKFIKLPYDMEYQEELHS